MEGLGSGICGGKKKKDSPTFYKQNHHGNKLDLVNGKLFSFEERGRSELVASVLVPRGI